MKRLPSRPDHRPWSDFDDATLVAMYPSTPNNTLGGPNGAHGVVLSGKAQAFRWGPEPRESVATSKVEPRRTVYVPPRWTNEIARPEGEHHKRHGSLQANGSVKPYHAPMHGCVGTLADRTSNARG